MKKQRRKGDRNNSGLVSIANLNDNPTKDGDPVPSAVRARFR